MSYTKFRAALVVSIGVFAVSESAHAFQPTTKVAIANQAQTDLQAAITPDVTTNSLTFVVNNQTLSVLVGACGSDCPDAKAAYQAIVRWPLFFKAGAVGTDAFPDPITGIFVGDDNQSALMQDIVRRATTMDGVAQVNPTNHAITVPFELRAGISEWRSIDFAMALLEFWKNGDYPGGSDEREQALAFVMGYFVHAVADGFSHTWSNQLTGAPWDLQNGSGIPGRALFGPVTEEFQRFAIETFVDRKLPASLTDLPGPNGRFAALQLEAPIRFLDAFYSSEVANPLPFGSLDGDLADFIRYYQQLDRFNGGMVYNILNGQVAITDKLEDFTDYGLAFDMFEQIINLGPIESALRTANWASDMAGDINNWVVHTVFGDAGEWILNEVAACSVTAEPGQAPFDSLLTILDFLTRYRERLEAHENKADIAKLNWLRLSECTAQNLAWIDRGDFDPLTGQFRDACAVLADAPFVEDGNPQGLYRGDVFILNPYLQKLRDAFRGADDNLDGQVTPNEYFEPLNRHRSIPSNIRRAASYLTTAGLTLPDLDDALLTEDLRDNFKAMCANVRTTTAEVCLTEALRPFYNIFQQVRCDFELAKCAAEKVPACLSGICKSTLCAGSLIPGCEGICDAGGEVCEAGCEAALCVPEFCTPTCVCPVPPLPCPTLSDPFRFCCPLPEICGFPEVCTPSGCPEFLLNSCFGICDFLSGGDPSCLPDLLGCTAEHFGCTAEILTDQFNGLDYADDILDPIRDLCDNVEPVLELWQQLKTPAGRLAFLDQELNPPVPIAVINGAVNTAINFYDGFIAGARNFPPEYLVDLAFLAEDFQAAGPLYTQSFRAAIGARLAQVDAQPPSPQRTQQQNALLCLVAVVDALEAGNVPPLAAVLCAVQVFPLGVIPDVPSFGPTNIVLLSDIGLNLPNTFDPFFNALHGAKIAPLVQRSDIESLFDAQGVGAQLLPWASDPRVAGLFSAHCLAPGANSLFCDVIASFNDPNCIACPAALLAPDPARNNWVPGRGLVVWNERTPATGSVQENVLTNFPVATTNAAYGSLYTRIFRVPDKQPRWASFEDPTRPWVPAAGSGGIVLDPNAVDGAFSVGFETCPGLTRIIGPTFRTTEFWEIGTQISLQVFVPPPAGRAFAGRVTLFVTIPDAGINFRMVDSVRLDSRPGTGWTTVTFNVPAFIQNALLADSMGASFAIDVLATPPCQDEIRVDDLRFTGTLTPH
jgi:hypothetical protein